MSLQSGSLVFDQYVVSGDRAARALPEAEGRLVPVHNSVDSAGQCGIAVDSVGLPGMLPLAARVLRMLMAERACAEQLAQRVRLPIEDVYQALVQLHDRDLAQPEYRFSFVPGVGRAKYWKATP